MQTKQAGPSDVFARSLPLRQMWPLVRTDGGSPCRPEVAGMCSITLPCSKSLYEASAYSFLHPAEKGSWKASAHTDLQNRAVLHRQKSNTDNR